MKFGLKTWIVVFKFQRQVSWVSFGKNSSICRHLANKVFSPYFPQSPQILTNNCLCVFHIHCRSQTNIAAGGSLPTIHEHKRSKSLDDFRGKAGTCTSNAPWTNSIQVYTQPDSLTDDAIGTLCVLYNVMCEMHCALFDNPMCTNWKNS